MFPPLGFSLPRQERNFAKRKTARKVYAGDESNAMENKVPKQLKSPAAHGFWSVEGIWKNLEARKNSSPGSKRELKMKMSQELAYGDDEYIGVE